MYKELNRIFANKLNARGLKTAEKEVWFWSTDLTKTSLPTTTDVMNDFVASAHGALENNNDTEWYETNTGSLV